MGKKGRHWKWSEESKQKRSNERKGLLWFTDGEKNILLRLGEEIPEGFYKGFTKDSEKCKEVLIDINHSRKGKHWKSKGFFRKWQD